MNQHICLPSEFTVAHTAVQDTEWLAEPANPVNLLKGTIRKGEVVWLHADLCGSGPVWQQACLSDKTLCYVHLSNFEKVVDSLASFPQPHDNQ